MSNLDSTPAEPVVFLPVDNFNVERVFPIRNLISDKDDGGRSSQSSSENISTGGSDSAKSKSNDDTPNENASGNLTNSNFFPPPYPHIPPDDTIRRLPRKASVEDEGSSSDPEDETHTNRKISERSQLVPARYGPPGIAPGIPVSNSAEQAFYRCEDEPIHIPGAIQQFGALIALKFNENSDLVVRICSENTHKILKYAPEQLFALKSFLDLLGVDVREDFIARVEHALKNAQKRPSSDTHLDVFSMALVAHTGLINLWCAIHIANGTEDLIICEFEEYHDSIFFSDGVHTVSALPKNPTKTIDNETVLEERLRSISSGSQPLRVLQIAKRRGRHAIGSMEVFNAMTQAQEQIASATSVQGVLDVVVGLISDLTGFHRVMFYRFDGQKNGCVEAELRVTTYLEVGGDVQSHGLMYADEVIGLHFPASDIPKQARDLYKINRIRILYDRDEETARLVCRDQSDFEKPLDLTHAYLRAMSPIHIKYLSNMGVRSSMSVSIVINDDLWGLIACHGYGDKGTRVTLPIRELCRNIGECASTNIERLLMQQRIQARKPPSQRPTQTPSGLIAASSNDLLCVFDADFGLLNIQDEARAIGKLRPYREALAILAHLQSRHFTEIFATNNVNKDLPRLKYPPGIHSIAGLLVIPLSTGGQDFLVFFRRGQLREVRWAGNPYEKIKRLGSQYLEPRSSFRRWTETIKGMSKAWNEDDFETASVLSLLYGRFIEIWRQKESAGQNRMTRLLIRNTSHEVRTPLNAIVNYLDMAMENTMEEPLRELLGKAHTASRSLDLNITTHQGIPEMVKGDAARLRQVLSNLTSNAFQNSVAGGVKIDMRPLQMWQNSTLISITVQDCGHGMSESQLDDLFQEFEQILDETDDPKSTLATAMISPSTTDSKPDSKETIGLGLAVVARYVRNMNGQIRVRSEIGKGTIFGIELPFEHAPEATDAAIPSSGKFLRSISEAGSAYGDSDKMISGSVLSAFTDTPLATPVDEGLVGATSFPDLIVLGSSADPMSASTDGGKFASFPPNPSLSYDTMTRKPLSILVAEDNPINAKLLDRRLDKLGHKIEIVNDGQACHDFYQLERHNIDVILMDLQMPLVDGAMATRMIRHFERDHPETRKARRRIPILAVSASLVEENRFEYIECGFDGWILKPIDFSRLDFLLQGLKNPQLKHQALYVPGRWESGGWFLA
ncbi:hypothetical protein CJF32_00000274 [Rutstroemia sp. NJR-2017a WRK4]|nr:hypothetical protein CJF32_00000274 [Rutstroemia sp. NJR-2017a WRK4]